MRRYEGLLMCIRVMKLQSEKTVTPSMLYTRRLMRKELDIWLHLGQRPTEKEAHYAKEFLNLPDSMFFLATIDDEPIGGTAIYRDRTRLAMALVATRIEKEFRENTPFQLFKASLPFFKTLAIRDVDALVGESQDRDAVPFPLSCKLQNWAKPALEKMGFEEVARAAEADLHGGQDIKIQTSARLDDQPDFGRARELLWNQRNEIGLSCSQQWLAFDLASARGTLKTFTYHNEICMALGIERLGHWNVITFFVPNPEVLSPLMTAELILHHFAEERITFSLVGEKQSEIVETASSLNNSILSMNQLILLRKLL